MSSLESTSSEDPIILDYLKGRDLSKPIPVTLSDGTQIGFFVSSQSLEEETRIEPTKIEAFMASVKNANVKAINPENAEEVFYQQYQ